MMKIKFLIIFFLVAIAKLSFSQPENAKIETIEGKQYYVHIVEQGNTLYGIQNLYHSDMEAILNANPGLSNNLAIGQRVLIPVNNSQAISNSKTHTVVQGETLYGISKKYGCTVSDLTKLNPGVENGISIGQELKIPASTINNETIQSDPIVNNQNIPSYNISYEDSLVKHVVLDHETLYSISKRYMVSTDTIMRLNNMTSTKVKKGDVLIIPVKNVSYEIVEKEIKPIDNVNITNPVFGFKRKDTYKIALMLPFMLDQNEVEMKKPLKIDQIRELLPNTKMSFEFYQGFMLAADSLQGAGLNAEIYIYDTKKDSGTIAAIFNKTEFSEIDLVVGPMYQNEVNVALKYCTEKNIPLILPFKVDAAVINKNPLVYKTVSSNMTLFDGAVDYIVAHHAHHNVLIVKPTSTTDLAIFERCKQRYNEKIKEVKGAMHGQIIEVNPGSTSGRDLETFIRKDTVNVILVPSENIKFVAGMMGRLNSVLNNNYRSSNMSLIIFGIEDWNRYQDLDMMHRNKLNQHYATYRYVDYNKEKGLDFLKSFRYHYGTDPTIFSTQGFDVGLYFMGALHLYGTNFHPYLNNYEIELIQNDFAFSQITAESGYENVNVSIVRYSSYTLQKMQ